jgi:hypothetical protein
MSSPTNIANRITAGLESINPPLTLIRIAAEATTQGINEASATLLQAWAADVLTAANELPGMAGQYWASIASELRSMAWERTTGVEK